ncbi:MAG: hypothetical protein C0462_13930 [Alcanivorax sp.]|nr:hypothetical protein [Alcanivorax sp.]
MNGLLALTHWSKSGLGFFALQQKLIIFVYESADCGACGALCLMRAGTGCGNGMHGVFLLNSNPLNADTLASTFALVCRISLTCFRV